LDLLCHLNSVRLKRNTIKNLFWFSKSPSVSCCLTVFLFWFGFWLNLLLFLQLKMADKKKLGFAENFMLSGVAAAVSKTAAAPIERVKLLVQNQVWLVADLLTSATILKVMIVRLRWSSKVAWTSHTQESSIVPSGHSRTRASFHSGEVPFWTII